jgi:hypothetical protein
VPAAATALVERQRVTRFLPFAVVATCRMLPAPDTVTLPVRRALLFVTTTLRPATPKNSTRQSTREQSP